LGRLTKRKGFLVSRKRFLSLHVSTTVSFMAGRYGISFAKVLIERGEYEEAIRIASDEANAGSVESLFDRATAHELMGTYDSALADFEACMMRNRNTKELDGFQLDDAYFGAVVAAATAEMDRDSDAAVAWLARYARSCPSGAHTAEVAMWTARVRGDVVSLLDKTVEM
jgi:hypothetical protein